ncbi:MAG: S8 family serine peptidase [Oligoflexales bacterium]
MKALRIVFLLMSISFAYEGALSREYNLNYPHMNGQLIVKFKPKIVRNMMNVLDAIDAKVEHQFASQAVLLKFPNNFTEVDLLEKAKLLADSGNVEYVEANTIVRAIETPNDSSYSELWGLEKIEAEKAWEVGKGSDSVLVGVIDTGLDYRHPDIRGNAWTNPGESGIDKNGVDKSRNGIDDDNNGFVDDFRGWDFVNNDNDPMDDNRHGTHCAGTIGAIGNNEKGVVGVNWNVSLVGIKFLSGSGSGSLSDAVKAIDYATELGVFLTNNSWGGRGYSQALYDAIERAQKADILFVAAAGNSGTNNDEQPHYPSNYDLPNVIAVAASTIEDKLASFSQYGFKSVHLAAPGKDILSTIPGGQYASFSGTSMASPHVAGAAALIKSIYPQLIGEQIKDKVLNTTDPIQGFAAKISTGGRLNLYNAVEKDTIPPAKVEQIAVSEVSLTSFSINFQGSGDDGISGEASTYEVRIATSAITNEIAWESAKKVALIPLITHQTYKIIGLPLKSAGFFVVRARDNAGNLSALSESVPFQLVDATVYAKYNADSMDEVDYDKPWGLEIVQVNGKDESVFSDSPDGKYVKDTDISLTLKSITSSSDALMLKFNTNYDLEYRFDFLKIEVSVNEAGWQAVEDITGNSEGWVEKIVTLRDKIQFQTGDSIRIRFRVLTDYSISKQGVLLDNIRVLGSS